MTSSAPSPSSAHSAETPVGDAAPAVSPTGASVGVSTGAALPKARTSLGSWLFTHPTIADALLATLVVTLSLTLGFALLLSTRDALEPTLAPLTVIAALINWLALTLRRRYPIPAWVITLLVPPAHNLLLSHLTPQTDESPYLWAALPVLFAMGVPILLDTLAIKLRPLHAWAAWSVSTAAVTISEFKLIHPGQGRIVFGIMLLVLLQTVGVLVGLNVRSQQERIRELEQRSARLTLAREQSALLAAANERSRIAREMHDVVAHSLAVMITMSDGAAATIDRDPTTAKQALQMLSETGRSALADTRRLVGVLRDTPATLDAAARLSETDDAPATNLAARKLPVPEFAPPGAPAHREPTEEIAALRQSATSEPDASTGAVPLVPAPESTDLDALVERFAASQMPINYRRIGSALPDDKGLQMAIYRIAQEALTNILRYAPTTEKIEVTLERYTGTAILVVENEAAPGTAPMHGSGKGLIGMRERAAVYGGTVEAGPTPSGWRVRALLRWEETSQEGNSQWQMPI